MARMNERGQILLIGAITIAVTFIALGIVLNGSLHTPTLAAQASEDVSDGEVQSIQDTVEREVAIIMAVARSDHTSDMSAQRNQVRTRTRALIDNLKRYNQRRDLVISTRGIAPVTTQVGRDFSEQVEAGTSDEEDPYSNIEFRQFAMEPSGLSASGTIEVQFVDETATDTYNIEIGPSELVNLNTGEACDYTTDIYFADAQTDQRPTCPALDFIDELGDEYDVTITANDGRADYEMIARGGTISGLSTGTQLVYQTRVQYRIYTPKTNYAGTIVVNPGEP